MRTSVAIAPRDFLQPLPEVPPENEINLSSTVRDHLGERLRAMYGQLREEPLPPRLRDLVHQLAETGSE
jgi:Anti-sigma factor NepR